MGTSVRDALLACVTATLVSACATTAPLSRPDIELPAGWGSARTAEAIDERWWTLFGDPLLNQYVDEALAHNFELDIAAARVLQARALSGIADAEHYPSVNASASSQRSKSTLEGSFPQPAGQPRIQTTTRIGVEASYELDLWGRYARASDAARADLLGAEWARRAVRLALIADVANTYHALRAADRQLANLNRTQVVRQDSLEVLAHRVRAGSAAEFELNQLRAEISAIDAQIARAAQRANDLETALGLLLGRTPQAQIEAPLPRGDGETVLTPQLPAGLPSELLLRRPDLLQAEMALMAADARIAEARALLFPSITLTASLGQESVPLSQLFTGGASIFNLGLGLTQPIWNAGRLQANIEATQAQRQLEEARYRQAIANAFGDVRRALSAQRAAIDALAAERDRASALREAVRQAGVRFDAGLSGRLEVLDAERNLLLAETAVIDAQAAQQTAVTDLIRALGGGWRAPQPQAASAATGAQ